MNRYLWNKQLRGCLTRLTPTEYIVLTMLATYSNRAGAGARPAAATLAEDCDVSVNTVRRALTQLVEKGYVIVAEPGGGRNRPTVYDLVETPPNAVGKPTLDDGYVSDEEHTHLDGYVSESKTTHPDGYVSRRKPTHETGKNLKTYPSEALNVPTQMGTDQVDQEELDQELPAHAVSSPSRAHTRAREATSTFTDGVPLPPEPVDDPMPATAGALALVPALPDRRPDGRRIPKRTRNQMLAELNATARSVDAARIASAFEASLGGRLDRATLVEIGQVCDGLLRDGIPPAQIAAGITAWHDSDRLYPSQIPRFVAKAARTSRPTTGKPTAAAVEAHDVAAQLIEELGL
ncbi:helix-turn-helix DNA binding protein [Gordonia phage Lennon]|uniref:Helix-turn-helix DNA binding protein n=2 Tax=Vividuovirus TaxID=2560251 RepID=A0A2U9PG43_9CAUD|nr:replication initiation protein [Gordonia phage Lennon]ATN90250.1 helix-turn-helix DNA binding protein [Gordonia phage Lennon]AWT50555.1 helix-turn-helix DNA binding protein [Gordonia phage Sitar]